MKRFIIGLGLLVSFFLFTSSVNAQYGCPPYGAECPASSVLVVDKFIRDPRQSGKGGDVYVDNLTLSDYKFAPGEDVVFKIVIKNTGNRAVENVEGIDTLPLLTDSLLLSGDTRPLTEITRTFGTLTPGESREWLFRVRVKGAREISEGIVCGDPKAINRIRVRAKDMPDTTDTSSFCIERKVLGTVTQPKAGNELYVVAGGLIALFGIGYFGEKLSYRIRR